MDSEHARLTGCQRLTPSVHAEDRDPSVDTGTDFYRFANGGWLDRHTIPAGFGAWGSFEEIHVRNEEVLRAYLGRAATAAAAKEKSNA